MARAGRPAGYVASLSGILVHELVGHGLTALLLGGSLGDVYVSPIGGQATASAPGSRDMIVLAAGALVELGFGLVAWRWARARLRSGRGGGGGVIVLWCIAHGTILDSVFYIFAYSAIASVAGASSGDWPLLLRRWEMSPWTLVGPGLLLGAALSVGLARDAFRIVANGPLAARGRTPLGAYLILALPGILLRAIYLAVWLPWMNSPVGMALGSLVDVLVLGGPGALWLQIRRREPLQHPGPSLGDSPAPEAPRVAAWSGALLVLALAAGWVFGPTDELRRGLAFGPPGGERYMEAAQILTLELELDRASGDVLRVRSIPRLGAGSPFRRRLTEAVARVGPSPGSAMRLTHFIATWNLDGAEVVSVSDATRDGDAWTWRAELGDVPDDLVVRVWPVTWVRESHVAAVRITGVAAPATAEGDPGTRSPGPTSPGPARAAWNDLERARLDRERARFPRAIPQTVDDPEASAERPELRGQREAGGPRADDQRIDFGSFAHRCTSWGRIGGRS